MKLENLHISEADLSRRDFLRRTGGGMVGLLTSGGIDLSTAKALVSPGQGGNKILLSLIPRQSQSDDLEEELGYISRSFPLFRKLVGKGADVRANANFDSFAFESEISPKKLGEMMSTYTPSNFGENVYQFDVPNSPGIVQAQIVKKGTIGYPDTPTYLGKPVKNVLHSQWESYGAYEQSPLSDNYLRLLKQNGIDPNIRPWNSEWSNLQLVGTTRDRWNENRKRSLRQKIKENPGAYKNLEDYGMTKADMVDPEADPEPEEFEQYEVPSDYKLASPMHQPFESRLLRALYAIA